MAGGNVSRRALLLGGGAAALCGAFPVFGQTPAQASPPVPRPYIGDMHSHYGMFLPRLFGVDLRRHMLDNGAMLIAWAATDDNRWIASTSQGLKQTSRPEPGALWDNFQRRFAGYDARLRAWGLPKALTPADVDAALDASDATMLWSHSWISAGGGRWQDDASVARSLSPAQAKKIAARGGLVGLWTVRVRNSAYPVRNVATFADETLRMCDLLGPEHVAFGTDMEGAGPNPILSDYADLREVVDNLSRRGLSDEVLQGICIGNYARVLKRAMNGAAKT